MQEQYELGFSSSVFNPYEKEQAIYILKQAQIQTAHPNYFKTTQTDHFKPQLRVQLIDWFHQVTIQKNFSPSVDLRAISLFDSLLSKLTSIYKHPAFEVPKSDNYTFAAAIVYDIAAKTEASTGIARSILKSFNITAKQLLNTETLVLETLDFQVCRPGPLNVIEVLANQLDESMLGNSRPETPLDGPNDHSRLVYLLGRASRTLHSLVKDEKLIGVTAFEQGLAALLAAAKSRGERISGFVRDKCSEYDVSYQQVCQVSKVAQQNMLIDEELSC
ncbi:Cyclin, N-terminal domain-containing protein [Spironucleus salmonicida]|uniref:Cyclin, N-terminal domain-containing protein n=1 Tax=Spironucleus salmonicida TaxID=348837 RepID=V6LVQ2_9EUKA|nr:Cyclin, N-terminal domain-containing protein [Spironucleus salmonicida]|eukprot:EST47781.1 Cyclin, N-terminal domain-containing protein [Spironucleus salmonicida]